MSKRLRNQAVLMVIVAGSIASSAFAQRNVPAHLVLQGGQVVPGTGGAAAATLNTAFTTTSGKVGFTGTLTGGTHFVWHDTGVVLWSGDYTTDPIITSPEDTMGVADGGRFVYSPSTAHPPASSNDSIWTNLGLLLEGRQPAPGIPQKFVRAMSRPQMFGADTFAFVASTADGIASTINGRAFYRGTIGPSSVSYVPVLKTGDLIGGFAITANGPGVEFPYDISDDGTHHIHKLGLDITAPNSNNSVIYKDGAIVLRSGQPASGVSDGTNWSTFTTVSTNNLGEWLVAGNLGASSSVDQFLAYNGVVGMRETDPPLANGLSLLAPALMQGMSLNNFGCTAVIWSYTKNDLSGPTKSLFAANANNLAGAVSLLDIGDILLFDGAATSTTRLKDFKAATGSNPGLDLADDGMIFVSVIVEETDGSNPRDAVIRLDFPCPVGCIADVDDGAGTGQRDGGVGIEDLLYYLTVYDAGTLGADVDDGSGLGRRDGGVGIEDLLYYLFRYDSGC